jgi:pyridoxine 5-phosphate synthase
LRFDFAGNGNHLIGTCHATYAHSIGLQVNAVHGLTLENTKTIAQLPEIVELNIGHSIIARAVFVGLESATNEMKNLMLEARL